MSAVDEEEVKAGKYFINVDISSSQRSMPALN